MRTRYVLATSVLAFVLSGCSSTTNRSAAGQPDMNAVPQDTLRAPPSADTADTSTSTMATPSTTNPLLAPWTGPHGGVPPWNEGSPERYRQAILQALDERRREYDAIVGDPSAPTFANTILPMQRAGRLLNRVGSMFAVMNANVTTPEYQALNRELAPKFAAANDEISFDRKLFERIAAVNAARGASGLTAEQQRLVERTYDSFVRSGAQLGEAQKQQLSAINQELAALYAGFSEKVLADENAWTVLERKEDLAGLPDAVIASAAAAAGERKLDGKWVIVNTRSSVDPFLTFSTRRDLREQVWRKFVNRGDNGDANDTNATIGRILKLRQERARLLSYPSHAHWRRN